MKTLALLLACGVLAGTAVAQESVTGCVSKLKHGEWVITAGQRQYRVLGSSQPDLSKFNGHTVRATGSVGTSDPAVQAVTPPAPGSTTGVTYNTISDAQVQDVSSNCSEHGGHTSK